MKSNCYIIDTSSLVTLNRNNPLDVFPSIWKKLEMLINSGRLISPREVFNEIGQTDDQLSDWTKKQVNLFKKPTLRQITIIQDILKKYPALIDINRKYDADPWVIALAVELTTDLQHTLFSIKRIVVTEETLRGNKIKIPFVCKNYEIESLNIVDFFRIEKWTF